MNTNKINGVTLETVHTHTHTHTHTQVRLQKRGIQAIGQAI